MIACYHPPKDGKMTIRGSAVQEDTSSGIWDLTRHGTDVLKLRVSRAKGKGYGNELFLRIEKVDLEGDDADSYGDPLQGIVLTPYDMAKERSDKAKAAKAEARERAGYSEEEHKVELTRRMAERVYHAMAGEPDKRWTVYAMAKALSGGEAMEIGGVNIPLGNSTLKGTLPALFDTPALVRIGDVDFEIRHEGEVFECRKIDMEISEE